MVIIISEGSYDLSASKNGFREQTIQVNVQPGGLFGGMDFTIYFLFLMYLTKAYSHKN